ncbi:DUF2141 domain-containing protein [Phormidium tenue FACHB-886]|nr:DUF2141 domain-containing protein [Phormidium tenue FACHB-886]
MVRKFRVLTLLLAVLVGWASSSSVRADDSVEAGDTVNDANSLSGNLTVEVDGLKSQEGQICINLFASSRGFPSNRQEALQRQCEAIATIPMTFTFNDLQLGNYAVAVYHDANGDEVLDRNELGMPIEGYGFSRNPVVRTGPPEFGDSAVLVAGSSTSIQIQLKY